MVFLVVGFFFFFFINVGDTGDTGVVDVAVVFAVVGVCGPFLLLELSLALLIVLLFLLLVQEPWFGFEEGMRLDFFPFFGGTPPLPGHLGPALLVTCFRLGLTRVLGRRCLTDGGGGCF